MPSQKILSALAIKELRESAAILGVATLAMLWTLGNVMGWRLTPFAVEDNVVSSIPFYNGEFGPLLIFIGGGLAILLGMKQSAWENNGQQYYFLLHRPVARQTVFLLKIACGLACLLLLTLGSVLIYALWSASPGNHATPFFWGMTADAWFTCLVLPSIYLGAMLSGLRPARWIGTRLLPLLGSVVLLMLAVICWSELSRPLGLLGLLVLDIVLVRMILATAEQRDY